MNRLNTLAEEPFQTAILDFFNLILGRKGHLSEYFWGQDIKTSLTNHFYEALSPQELERKSLKPLVDFVKLFKR